MKTARILQMDSPICTEDNNCEVPELVINAVREAIQECDDNDAEYAVVDAFRKLITAKVAKRMTFSFCSDYRHELTPLHGLIYDLVSTVEANYSSGKVK